MRKRQTPQYSGQRTNYNNQCEFCKKTAKADLGLLRFAGNRWLVAHEKCAWDKRSTQVDSHLIGETQPLLTEDLYHELEDIFGETDDRTLAPQILPELAIDEVFGRKLVGQYTDKVTGTIKYVYDDCFKPKVETPIEDQYGDDVAKLL